MLLPLLVIPYSRFKRVKIVIRARDLRTRPFKPLIRGRRQYEKKVKICRKEDRRGRVCRQVELVDLRVLYALASSGQH